VLFGTCDKVAGPAARALVALATVPAAADALPDRPVGHAGPERHDLADDLVARDAGELLAQQAVLGDVVTAAAV
jgi:hypothetical protein